MPSDPWELRRLRDLVDERGITYGVVQPGNAVADGVPIVRVNNFRRGGLRLEEILRVSSEVEAKYSRSRLRGGEVLITLVGTVGLTAIAPERAAGWNVARAVGVIPVRNTALAHWVRWCLEAPAAMRHLESRLNTTVQKTLNLGDLNDLEIPVPPVAAMSAIATVLGALDNKIESNERRSDLQAKVIDAMFDHHVVAHADSNDSANGDLTSIARFVNGRAFTKGATGTGRPVLRIKELNSGITDATIVNNLDADDDNIARHHDLLFSWSGSLATYRWHGPESLVNQHIFKVLPYDEFPIWFVQGWVRRHLPEFQRIARDKATTMGHIKREHLKAAKVRIPPADLITDLHRVLGPLDDQLGVLAAETITLRAIRYELLPKLISGEIRIPADGDERLVA